MMKNIFPLTQEDGTLEMKSAEMWDKGHLGNDHGSKGAADT